MKAASVVACAAAALLGGCGGGAGSSGTLPNAGPIVSAFALAPAKRMRPNLFIPLCKGTQTWCTRVHGTADMSLVDADKDYTYDSCDVDSDPGCPDGPQLRSVNTSSSHELASQGESAYFQESVTAQLGSLKYTNLSLAKSPYNREGKASSSVGAEAFDQFKIGSKTLGPGSDVTLLFTLVLTPAGTDNVDCGAGNGTSASLEIALFTPSEDPHDPIAGGIIGECDGTTPGSVFGYKTLGGKAALDTEVLETGTVGSSYQFGLTSSVDTEANSGCEEKAACKPQYESYLRGVARLTIQVTTPGAYITTASGYKWH